MTSRSTDKWLWTRTHRIIQMDDEVYVYSKNHFDWFKSSMMYQWSIGFNRRIWNWPSFIPMASQLEVYDPILPSITAQRPLEANIHVGLNSAALHRDGDVSIWTKFFSSGRLTTEKQTILNNFICHYGGWCLT